MPLSVNTSISWNFPWQDELEKFPDPAGLHGRLETYLGMLLDWNARVNLISRRETDPEIHFVDSLHFASALPPDATVADIGTGAGFPGMVTALARPDVRVTLVEPILKKQAFLQALIAHFHLDTVTLRRARLENGVLRDVQTSRVFHETWGHVVCKALTSPENFRKMAGNCAGTLWFLASADQACEAPPAWREHHRWVVAAGRVRVLLQLPL